MKNAVVVIDIGMSRWAAQALTEGLSSRDLVLRKAAGLPELEKRILLTDRQAGAEGFEVQQQDKWSMRDLLARGQKLCAGLDQVFFVYADAPFLDLPLCRRLYDIHVKYRAQYTFADGYPWGLCAEIVKAKSLSALVALAGDEVVDQNGLFDTVKKDINSFDIETEIPDVDLRMLRLSLRADSKRNYLLLKNFAELGATGAEAVMKAAVEHPEILRTVPSYINVQTVSRCPTACSYCPYPKIFPEALTRHEEMDGEKYSRLMNDVADYCDSAVVGMSTWGEPLFHSRFEHLAAETLKHPGLSLSIETTGVGVDAQRLLPLLETGRTSVIISLDASDAALYQQLRGEGFLQAQAFAQSLVGHPNVHIQAVRMNENEEQLEKFWRFWKEKTPNVIAQKYDNFCGFLPQKKVVDLSPIKRFACWHIKRDLMVSLDGTAALCREDLAKAHVLGNVFTEPLSRVWAAGDSYYRRDLEEKRPDLCSNCDEYYTFNF